MENKMIQKCTCKSDYQDQKHGAQMRVFNPLKKGVKGNDQKHRCTVCLVTK